MVEVFKTNAADSQTATLVAVLAAQLPQSRINFDLEDCDRVLRIESSNVFPSLVIDLLRLHGCDCSILE